MEETFGVLWLVIIAIGYILGAVFAIMIAVAPLYIWKKLQNLLDEQTRHNKRTEVCLDFIMRQLKELTPEQ